MKLDGDWETLEGVDGVKDGDFIVWLVREIFLKDYGLPILFPVVGLELKVGRYSKGLVVVLILTLELFLLLFFELNFLKSLKLLGLWSELFYLD